MAKGTSRCCRQVGQRQPGFLGAEWGLAGLQQGMGGSLWAERGRTWVFEILVEGAHPLLVLEMGRKASARVLMCGGDTPETLTAWGFVARPARMEAGIFGLRLT